MMSVHAATIANRSSITRARAVRGVAALTAVTALGLGLSACASETGSAASANTVTLVVHDSFPNEEFAQAASEATGYDVEVIAAGAGGELTNKLVLTQGAPIGDAFYGVDNIFASRLVDSEAVEPYRPADLPESAAAYAFDEHDSLTPVDVGATCINIDTAWFAEHSVAEPNTFDDLVKPEYADLTVLLDPVASSTGGSMLIGTVAAFGEEGYLDYWQSLVDNGARIEQSWSDAYYGQFSGAGEGSKPIVLSYSSSPSATLNDDETATSTRALLDTCTSNIEYAGVLAGAENPEGARAVIDYLVSEEFQRTIPDSMYMYPVNDAAPLPDAWERFAPLPAKDQLNDLASAEIEAGRETWLKTLGEQIGL